MKKKLIYLADDDIKIRELIKSFLLNEGYEVKDFSDGLSLMNAFYHHPPDMIIIDIMMPNMDGYTISTSVRQKSNIPIIIVSAKDAETDKIAGLALGSDDYLTKPFSPLELMARVKSLFRRIQLDQTQPIHGSTLELGDIIVYSDEKRVACKGMDISLTIMEFDFLTYLIKNHKRALSRDELLNQIWGFDSEVDTRVTDDIVKRIRKKLETAQSGVKIKTVWGFGYKIVDGSTDT